MRTRSEEVDHWLEQAAQDIDNKYVLAALVSLSIAVKNLHGMVKDEPEPIPDFTLENERLFNEVTIALKHNKISECNAKAMFKLLGRQV